MGFAIGVVAGIVFIAALGNVKLEERR